MQNVKLQVQKMSSDIPRKFERILSKDSDNFSIKLIQSGPPKCYEIKPKMTLNDEGKATVKTLTFGNRDYSKPNKTILLVGETGTGKSTMVNVLFNYIVGVEWADRIWFEIVKQQRNLQTDSQTSEVTVYEIFGFEGIKVPFSLTIIDTPGYGTTKEIEQDMMVSKKLHGWFVEEIKKGYEEIHAVCLVMKANVNRLTDRQKYIFDAVGSLFGTDLENNIVVLMTHSNGLPPTDAIQALQKANIKCAKDEMNTPINFLFNNCQSYEIKAETEIFQEAAWKLTTQATDIFSTFLQKVAPQKLKKTVKVLKERVKLTAGIDNILERIKLMDLKHTEIQQTQEALTKHNEEMQSNQTYTIEVDEPYKEKVPIDGWWDNKALCCTVCEETCHYPGCTLARNPWWCKVITSNYCTVCTGKCHHTKHVREKWRFDIKTRKVCKTLEDLKQKYVHNSEAVRQKERLLSALQDELKTLEVDEARLVEEAYQSVTELAEIALNTNSMYVHVHLEVLIEKMKKIDDKGKVRKLENIKNHVEEEQKDGISYLAERLGRKTWKNGK